MLPSYVRGYVNRTLDQSPDYHGQIGTIDIHLWKGRYSVHDVEISKVTETVPVPFFSSPQVDFSVDWPSLYHGAVRARVRMDKPRINFVQGPTEEESQTGAGQPWLDILNKLSPFRIDKARIIDGEIHFHAFHKKPPVNVYLSDVQATLTNLTNIQNKLDPLIANVHATGTAMESGQFEFDMNLDPESHRPTFDLTVQLLDMDVTRLNSLAIAYGDFDFTSGRFDFVLEASVKDGFLTGYAKPLFRNLHVLSLSDVKNDNALELLWEALVGVAQAALKNQPRDQFGTRITLSGNLDNPQTSLLEVIGNVLRNAFVRAYLPRVEHPPEMERPAARQEGGDKGHL